MKDYEKMVNCNDTYCEYFDERMELNCAYSEDNSECIKTTVLSLEEILRDAVRRQATYQVQFADYDLNTWTAPSQLTQNRMDKLLDDASIRKVRLELEF